MSYQAVIRDVNNALVTSHEIGMQIRNTAYSNTGNTLTYNSLTNGSYPLKAGDRIQFDYFY